MEFEIIAASIVTLAAIVIGSALWIRQSFSASAEAALHEELEQKRDLAAQVPLLTHSLEESKTQQHLLQQSLEALRAELAAKAVTLAEGEKDRQALRNETLQLQEALAAVKTEYDRLKEQETAQHETLRQLKSDLDRKAHLESETGTLKNQLQASHSAIETMHAELQSIHADRAALKANLDAQQENNARLKKDFEEQSKRLELKLNEIMQHHLENKLKKFDETSMKSLDTLLKPFRENLESFKKKVEDSQQHSTQKFAELSKEIEQVTKAGLNISKEAESLTKALKGKKQTQGSWGEMILESVLEYSGLLKGVHYETQESYRDEEGKTKRPDVVIKLPQARTIIIDSKVSLNDYDRYIRAETDEERLIAAKGIATAFRSHVDTLDSKDYAHYRIGTLQYVFMFVPIEGAFAMAVQQDPTLYEYALKKHIAIVNPSTLTVSLRTIYLYWQSEQSSSLASKLFDEAGKLYDKMTVFAESFNRLGNQIKTLGNTFDLANRQLSEGRGNLLSRTENLKRLGATTSKSLKTTKIEYQDFDDTETQTEMVDTASPGQLRIDQKE